MDIRTSLYNLHLMFNYLKYVKCCLELVQKKKKRKEKERSHEVRDGTALVGKR